MSDDAQDVIEITEGLTKAIGANSGLNSTLKFDFEGKGIVYVDGKSTPNTVSNDDKPADCTIMSIPTASSAKKLLVRSLTMTPMMLERAMRRLAAPRL